MNSLASLDVDSALAEISNGTIARTIAKRYGVTPDGLRKALKRAKPEEYKAAVSEQVEHWVFDSADEMNSLEADNVCIARARARADFRLKLAGALNPAFAAKQEITHELGQSFEALLGEISARRHAKALQHGKEIDVTPNPADYEKP